VKYTEIRYDNLVQREMYEPVGSSRMSERIKRTRLIVHASSGRLYNVKC
jgi:hypothetical protein